MAGSFEGKVALVTGAGSGIGRVTALAFVREGAKVVVADWSEDGGNNTVAEIKALGGEAIFVKVDVSKEAQVEAMVAKAVETFGRIDCAYNNAGVSGDGNFMANVSEESFDRIISVNLKGVFLCLKHEIRQMMNQGGGAIVNTSSVAGLVGGARSTAYNAAKHGVSSLTKCAAIEYSKKGIRVNAVCPAVVVTPMTLGISGPNADPKQAKWYAEGHPIGRLAQPEEIAEAVLFLCSDKASFITGVPLPVDGGWVAK